MARERPRSPIIGGRQRPFAQDLGALGRAARVPAVDLPQVLPARMSQRLATRDGSLAYHRGQKQDGRHPSARVTEGSHALSHEQPDFGIKS